MKPLLLTLKPLLLIVTEEFKDWSVWAPIIVVGQIVGLIVYEVYALHRPGDKWPTITAMTIFVIRKFWWMGVVIFGALIWLIVHFAERLIPNIANRTF